MTLIQLAKPADAEAIAAFANGSFTHTFGHIYDPADLSAFLAGWNPPDRVRAQIASDDYDIALVRAAAGALLGYIRMGPVDFARKSVVEGKGVAVRVDLGGRSTCKTQKESKLQ